MEYEEFKKQIMMRLVDFYGNDAKIEIQESLKNNGFKVDGVHIFLHDLYSDITPIIYIDAMYKAFTEGLVSLDECVGAIVDLRRSHCCNGDAKNIKEILSHWELAKNQVYPILLQEKENEEMLERLVSKKFLDMAIIYAIRIFSGDDGVGTVKVTYAVLTNLGISEDEVHEVAMNNLRRDGYSFVSIDDILYGGGELYNSIYPQMYVLSNRRRTYGAAGLLYAGILKEFAKNRDFYVLPSSVHECIFIPADGSDNNRKELSEMVKEVNKTDVMVDERLSDHIYYYCGSTGELQMSV